MFVNFVHWSPLVSIIVFSLLITAALSFLYKKLTDQKEFERLRNRQKEMQQQMKECKDQKKLAEIQKEMLQDSMASMKLTFKPMIITIIPLWFVFYGLKKLYTDMAGVGNIISWPWNLPMVGDGGGWLFCYVTFSFVFSLALRKIFKLS
jgi:uncharacterized membrane protein (DUF106 family)